MRFPNSATTATAAAAFLVAFALQSAEADDLQAASFDAMNTYTFLRPKLDACGLDKDNNTKKILIRTMSGSIRIDLFSTEANLDLNTRLNAGRLSADCNPEDVSFWFSSFNKAIDRLHKAIMSESN